jgi:hypothetical protein
MEHFLDAEELGGKDVVAFGAVQFPEEGRMVDLDTKEDHAGVSLSKARESGMSVLIMAPSRGFGEGGLLIYIVGRK